MSICWWSLKIADKIKARGAHKKEDNNLTANFYCQH